MQIKSEKCRFVCPAREGLSCSFHRFAFSPLRQLTKQHSQDWVVYATVCNLSHCASVLMVTDAVEANEQRTLKIWFSSTSVVCLSWSVVLLFRCETTRNPSFCGRTRVVDTKTGETDKRSTSDFHFPRLCHRRNVSNNIRSNAEVVNSSLLTQNGRFYAFTFYFRSFLI